MKLIATTNTAAFVGVASSFAYAEDFATRLTGFQEVPASILSPGSGKLYLNLDRRAGTLNYTLSYTALSSPVTQAHIHFGQKHTAGGIMVFFCSNLGNGPPGTPACPANGGAVSGTITADKILGPTAQNVSPNDFDALVKALVTKTAYANVHTTRFPPGEIRGQIYREHWDRHDDKRDGKRGGKHDDDDHHHDHHR